MQARKTYAGELRCWSGAATEHQRGAGAHGDLHPI
jgi:hypothetical protein